MNQLCKMKGISRQFSVARSPQHNGVAERRNMILIEAARTMLGFFVGYSLNSKAFRVFTSRTRILEENLHIRFSESTPNVVGTQSNGFADTMSSHDDGSKHLSDNGKKVDEDPRKENEFNDQEKEDNVNSTNNVNIVSSTVNDAGTNVDNEPPFDLNIPALKDVSIFNFLRDDEDDEVKTASTPVETQKPLLKDEDGKEVDVDMYRYQVNLKVSCLHDVKRIFRYLKGQPKLSLWYPKDSPFDLIAYTDSDYAGATLDRKSTTEDEAAHKELGNRLVRVATTTYRLEAEQDIGNITKTQSKVTPNESSLQGTNSGGGPRCQKTIRVTIAQIRVLDLEKTKTSLRNEIDSLKRRVKKLEKIIRLQAQEQEELFDAEKRTLFQQLLKKRTKVGEKKEKRAGEELIQKSTKKKKVEDDKEKAELKQLTEIILDEEEVAIDAIPLAVKSLRIVD
nr:hypothetical protein [Tanacetum cinerariifolium]